MATSLILAFKTDDGKICNIKVNDPKDNISRSEAEAAMNTIIEKNVFETSSGAKLTAIDDIYTVTTAKSQILI